ncbi:histidine kinase dimerization/phosphoacceptor domain -containing protein [Flavobacterium capsici]|uniref:histidine kinase n=1 Tax=Flavobacterium capsici TaxID=3075618 RepID=A0AA96EUU8_9FLAO|nr:MULTISPECIES: histidine kinase dimerization/phosphoacceptor domain -containing protein [unclassified Flavobacterium]WNM18666.1 histidine kinase dimerization/phosphoacceptor domain -containing protein [Flavobacterium sp. PMR2A8]WNM22717.1 histidine kinase dimerization/phosphoacceptor domain -containing protein [Flavobacterium sp. PMTSA4]
MFSQKSGNKGVSAKEALELSNKYKERANWFTNMPQYNTDSTQYYSSKAIAVLDANEPLHQYKLLELKFNKNKNKYSKFSLNAQDSIYKIEWNNYDKLDNKITENRLLKYGYLVNWANIKLYKGDSEESLDLFEKALRLITKKDVPNVQARALLDKGLYYGLYGLESEKKLSHKYLQQSLKFYKNHYSEYPGEFYMINAELVYYFYSSPKKDSLHYYFNEVKKLLPIYKKPAVHFWYYSMLANYLTIERKFDEARANYLKALVVVENYSFNDHSIHSNILSGLGYIAMEEKKYDEALEYYLKANSLLIELNDNTEQKITVLDNIGSLYEEKGDFKNALKYRKELYEASLAIEKQRNERSLRESELKVDVSNKEKELSQKKNQQLFYLIALGLCIILLVLIYRNVRLKQKSNLKLAAINNELEEKNLLLDKRNAENELLLKEIHHRVKNNLEVVSGLLALQSAQIDDKKTKDAMQESQNRVNSIGIVHQKLYQGKNLGAIEMKEYVLNLSESILDSFGAEGKIHLELAMEKLDLDIDTAVPLGLIINELITNTVKYAFPENQKGTLTIKLERQPENILHLVVSDDGVGKSGVIKGTGFGGQLISLLTNQLNGTMKEENNNGTSVIFDFKLKKSA